MCENDRAGDHHAGPVTVSFIIPNWNNRVLLDVCLKTVYAASRNLSHEVILVDNGSNDDSVSFVREHYPGVRLVANGVNLGYAKAINQGAEIAIADVLVLLNNDVELLPSTVETLLGHLGRDPQVGAVAPLLYYPDGRLQISCRRFPTPAALLLEMLGVDSLGPFGRWKVPAEELLRGGDVEQPMTAVLAVRRLCWEEVGPMDEGFPIFFNDVDWFYRLHRKTDCRVTLCTDARAVHHEGASTRTLGLRKKTELLKGLIRFYLKHYVAKGGAALAGSTR